MMTWVAGHGGVLMLTQFTYLMRAQANPTPPVRIPPTAASSRLGARRPSVEWFRAAAAEPSRPLDSPVRESLARDYPYDFTRVRVHAGEASRTAAESVDARAYTLGRDVHLGAEAVALSGRERAALLSHEALHSAQQGMRHILPSAGLLVSNPADPAEREAKRIEKAVPASSRRLRPSSATAMVAASVSPHIQRDLRDPLPVDEGTFKPDMKAGKRNDGRTGMQGTIEFTPNEKARDSPEIKLLQVARLEDLDAGKEYTWKGNKENLEAMKTTGLVKKFTPGFFVDHYPERVARRKRRKDERVSPYYRDHAPNPGRSQNGKKQGKDIVGASIWDNPGWSRKSRYSFETAAQCAETLHSYGTLTWGFTISDPDNGIVESEHASASPKSSDTFKLAVSQFNEFYRNPGSRSSPEALEKRASGSLRLHLG
jgi:Domain of unknown function (DUF4157)